MEEGRIDQSNYVKQQATVLGSLIKKIFIMKPTKPGWKKHSPHLYLKALTMQPVLLTESARSVLLASPTVRMALSTSLCPGRQFTDLFRA